MKRIVLIITTLAVAVFITVSAGVIPEPATAQGSVPPVTNIELRNGPNSGEVIVSWDAVRRATHYRIGYVNIEVDYHLAKASCTEEWIEAFVYVDVNARNIPVSDGHAEYTIRRLSPGARHAFTVLTSNNFGDTGGGGSVSSEFFWPSNPRWTFLDGRRELPEGTALPTGECTELTASQTNPPATGNIDVQDVGNPGGEVVISWNAVPQATHYRIGYVNMEVDYHLAKASCTKEWIEAFVYVDVNARNIPVSDGHAEYTIRRLSPGARHAFTVLTSNNFGDTGGGGSVSSEFFWPSNPRWTFLDGRRELPEGITLPTGECYDGSVGDGDTDAGTDRVALAAFYNATGGASWANNTNWLSDAPIGEWHGVTTDASGRVTKLDLTENGLTGPVPAQLGSLTSLEMLRLSENQLTGTIPAELGRLSNLTHLSLRENELTGPVPPWLGSMANLVVLSLNRNQLEGPIPAELGRLASLEQLYVGGNRLTGEIPGELERLTNLKRLYLWDNELDGAIPSSLVNLTSLEVMNLRRNQLEGHLPLELARLSNLKELELWGNQLTGPVPAWLDDLTKLEVLRLEDNQLTGSIPPQLGNLSNLERLDLDDNPLTPAPIPPQLVNLSKLKHLDLNGTRLTGVVPAWLGNLSNLEYLNLNSNQLTGPIPSELERLSNLTELYLWGNELTGPVPAWLGDLTKLEALAIGRNQLTGEIPSELGNLTNLEALGLNHNRLTGRIPSELARLSNLTALSLRENQLTGPIPTWLGNLTELTRLRLSNNRLTGPIPAELGNLSNLEVIDLAGNQLTGCVPAGLRDVETNDFGDLGLPFCGSPTAIRMIAAGGTNVVLQSVETLSYSRQESTAFHWQQLSGPSVELHDQNAEYAQFTAPTVMEDTNLVFRLERDGAVLDTVPIRIVPKRTERVLAALVDFLDVDPEERPFSREDIVKLLEDNTDSLSNFIWHTSRGLVSVDFNVLDWVTVDKNRSDYWLYDISSQAPRDAVSKMSEFDDLSKYDKVMPFIFPVEQGLPGCAAYLEQVPFDTPNGRFELGIAWLSGYDMDCARKGRIAHEFGHTFGLVHSYYIHCNDPPPLIITTLPPTRQMVALPGNIIDPTHANDSCASNLDPAWDFDMLGGDRTDRYENYFPVHFHATWQDYAGWLAEDQVLTPDSSGEYWLTTLESFTPAPKGMKILLGSDQKGDPLYYWLQTREFSPCKIDVRLQASNIHGVDEPLFNTYYVEGWTFDSHTPFWDVHRGIRVDVLDCKLGEPGNPVKLRVGFTQLNVDPEIVAVFGTREATVTLTNNDSLSIDVGSAALDGRHPNAFAIDSDECSNGILAPNASCTIAVRFTSLDSQVDAHGLLKIPNNDALGPEITVSLFRAADPSSLPDACVEHISPGSIRGSWNTDCVSATWPNIYNARFYTFTLETESTVRISIASEEPAKLFLYSSGDVGGTVLAESPRDTGHMENVSLPPGTYTIEAITVAAYTTGDFTLTLDVKNE